MRAVSISLVGLLVGCVEDDVAVPPQVATVTDPIDELEEEKPEDDEEALWPDAPEAITNRGVVNANLHPMSGSSPSCSVPSFPNLGPSPYTLAHSFHVSSDCRLDAALGAPNWNKARIISDDVRNADNEDAKRWIGTLCGVNQRGLHHYEHYEKSLNTLALQGTPISGLASMGGANGDAGRMLTWIKNNGCQQTLVQNGKLHRYGTTKKLAWNGNTRTLIGFGFMGALTAGDTRLAIDDYLGTLRKHRVNLTRVWAVEQWTGLAVDRPGGYLYNGVAPFGGSLAPGSDYDLDADSGPFYDRLRRFVQSAADRGIVVQLSLFDKHGLISRLGEGQWLHSPYNADNNDDGYLTSGPTGGNLPPPDFLTHPLLDDVHARFIRRVVDEVGGTGNVMFEIINEAKLDDWPNEDVEQWQEDVAYQVSLALPASVSRDAFNGDANNALLDGKKADANGPTWGANNAKIVAAQDGLTNLLMGRVVAQGTAPMMSANLPISTGNRTALSVRADLVRERGSIVMGFHTGGDDRVNVVLSPPETDAAQTRATLQLRSYIDGTWQIQSTQVGWIGDAANLRLSVDLQAGTMTVYLMSKPVPGMVDVPLPSVPVFNTAYFVGVAESGNFLPADGSIDNFEAAVYCTAGGC
jgi:hypothetical protein